MNRRVNYGIDKSSVVMCFLRINKKKKVILFIFSIMLTIDVYLFKTFGTNVSKNMF